MFYYCGSVYWSYVATGEKYQQTSVAWSLFEAELVLYSECDKIMETTWCSRDTHGVSIWLV